MSDLSLIPLQDGFETQLSQDWDGNTGTVYVLSTPSYTPTTTNTYIVVNPGKTNMQIAEITSYDSALKTLTVSSISFEKGLGISSTAQSHSTGSKVIISDNYQFWEDIQTAVNSKLDDTGGTMTGGLDFSGTTHAGLKVISLTTVQRDALTPANGNIIYNSTAGEFQIYQGGAWSTIASGSTQPNASATVAGKVEIATTAESIAGTDTGGTGALLSALPSDIAKNTQSGTFVYGTDVGGDDTYVVALVPVLAAYTSGQTLYFKPTTANTGACSVDFGPGVLNIKTKDGNDPQSGVIRANTVVSGHYDGTNFVIDNEDFATTANKGIVEMATDAEAQAQTDTERYITPAHLALTIPPFEQTIGVIASTSATSTASTRLTSETDGSAIYMLAQATASDTLSVRRYGKIASTGKYLLTHTAAFTSVGTSNWSTWSCAIVGSYLYVVGFSNAGTTRQHKRFDKADLANATTLTLSGTGWANGNACTTNGTDLLVFESSDTFRQYTISGTTITNVGTITFTSAGAVNNGSAIYDGTYIHTTDSSVSGLRKYNTTGGTAVSTNSTYSITSSVFPNQQTPSLFVIKTGILGYSLPFSVHSDTAMVGLVVTLTPFIKNTY